MSMSRRRVVGHALPALVLLLALSQHAWMLLAALRSVYWLVVRLAQLAVVLVGSGSFWWVLRSYQLAKEQELLDQAWSKYQFYERYRQRSSSSSSRMSESTTSKRLPVNAHLRTVWRLPPDVSDELALVVQCAVRDYVAYWFEPISPVNDDFQRDLKRLLADLLGALTARVLAIDSSQALALAASVLELVRLHLGWFREAYAQLEETDPSAFQGDDALDATLLARRQVLVAAYAQTAAFLHPGCVAAAPGSTAPGLHSSSSSSATSRKAETPEVVYLRHVASQVLQQLQPELSAAQCESNVVVSMVSSLLREAATFKVLAPLAEYAQPQFANELALTLLQSLGADEKDAVPLSPTHGASPSPAGVGGMTLQRLRLTKSLLYRATKRSSEQAEAAFQAVVDVVSAAAASSAAAAATGASGASDAAFDSDDWHDASPDALSGPASAPSASRSSRTPHERKQPFASLFSFDDRLSLPRTSRLKTPRAFRPAASLGAGTSGLKSAAAAGAAHMDDLKNIKANIGSSLNKVKRRFRTLSGHPNDPEAPHSGTGTSTFASTQAAARMMKKPGMLLQKALRRHDGPMTPSMMATMDMSPMSPTNSLDEVLTPPPLSDDDFGDHESPLSEPPSPTLRADPALSIDELAGDGDTDDDDDDDGDDLADDDESVDTVENAVESPPKPDALSPVRAVELLDKAVANYVRMSAERPEMRTSARARELYDLLAALEAVFVLGYRDLVENVEIVENVDQFDTGASDENDDMERSDRDVPQYWRYFAVERSDTPFLTEHWRFVSAKCPACVPSESFVSTRGVQWLLVALEKGALWEYVTALHLNVSVTAQFYDQPDAVVRSRPLMERVLTSLFALNKVRVALEIPHVLGRRSEMDEAFGVIAVPPLAPAPSVRIVESVWEVERYVPIHGWTKAQDKRWRELPSSEWIWETEWTLTSATSAPGWAYAKTFDDRFHDKERKFDSVRRRKWVRRRRLLPPVLTAVSAPALAIASPRPNGRALSYTGSDTSSGRERSSSTKSGPASPPALFGAASLPVAPVATVVTLGAGKVRNLKQFFDASKRSGGLGKAKTDDAAALGRSSVVSPPARSLLKRRSNSFDKAMLAEAVADLALVSPPSTPAASPAPVASGKAKRRSIPSLRRSQTSSEKDVKTALGLVRSTTTGSAATRPRDLVVQTDADDSACFRCLVPLDSERDDAETGQTCPNCEQRVCPACLDCFAFATLPPPLEVSRKSRMCRACYDRWTRRYRLKLGAHVSKYFARDSDSTTPCLGEAAAASDAADATPTSPGPSAAAKPASPPAPLTAKFEVVVFLRDDPAQAWSVVKSFQDFEALEKQLSEKLKKQEKRHGAGSCRGSHWKGVDYSELLDLAPRLTKLPVAALAYDKRLYVLEAFVQSLLASDTLCQSPAVQKFLLLSNAVGGAASAAASPFSTYSAPPEAPLSPLLLPTAPSSAPSTAGVLLLEHGKWRKGKWVAPETSSKETKVRLLQQLEVRLFAVVGEVFEFDGIGVVRRQLFAMSRSFVKAFLSASHFRKLEKQYASLTDSTRVAALLVAFRTYMFPDPTAPPVAPVAPLSTRAMQTLRKDALDAIVASFPSTLVSLFGDTSCANAALKLHEFLQHEIFVKNLLFCIADDVLAQLFPDSAPFKPKAAHAEQPSRTK